MVSGGLGTTRRPTLAVVAALVVAGGGLFHAHTSPVSVQTPTFRAEVGLVQVPVVVRGRDGEPVRGLPHDAFAVFEAGRRMTLISVDEIRREATATPYEPRDIVLVIDDLNTRPEVMPRATMAARAMLDQLDPRDRVALISTSAQPGVSLDFTTTRTPLVHALQRVRGQHLPDGSLGYWRSRQGLGVLKSLLERLRGEADAGRRLPLVLFTEGYGIPPVEQSGLVDRDLLEDVRTVVGLAAQADVAIYAIDPAGLDVSRGLPSSTGARPVGPGAAMRRAGVAVSSSLMAPDDLSALGALAHDTGGRLTRSTNDLLANLTAMLSDADEFYVLTYEMPAYTDRDRNGRMPHVRQLDVRVHRAGVDVRARQGYVHPRALS